MLIISEVIEVFNESVIKVISDYLLEEYGSSPSGKTAILKYRVDIRSPSESEQHVTSGIGPNDLELSVNNEYVLHRISREKLKIKEWEKINPTYFYNKLNEMKVRDSKMESSCRDTEILLFLNLLGYKFDENYKIFNKLFGKFLEDNKENIGDINVATQLLKLNNPQGIDTYSKYNELDKRRLENLDRYSKKHFRLLLGKKWWFYFYGYGDRIQSKNINTQINERSFPLIKLVLSFDDIDESKNLKVSIQNTGYEHPNYFGLTEFQASDDTRIIMNLYTTEYFNRHLNVVIDIGMGNGKLFLGQFLNYDASNIISGSIVLQPIDDEENPKPRTYRIPFQDDYNAPIEDIDPCILYYFRNKVDNFRKTPHQIHSIETFNNWKKSRET